MRRFVVSGYNGAEPVNGVVYADDASHAFDLAERAGLERVSVAETNRRTAREHGVYGPKRRRPRRMAVPKELRS